MKTLDQIEKKIAALKQRHTELNAKLFGPGGGAANFDASVDVAIRAVAEEIGRLNALREKALVGGLIDDVAPAPSPAPAAVVRTTDLPLPNDIFEFGAFDRDDGEFPVADRYLDLSDEDRKSFDRHLLNCISTNIADTMQDFGKGAPGDVAKASKFLERPVRYTVGFHYGIFLALAKLTLEVNRRFLIARDYRNDLAKRVEALEARPVLMDAGVWNQEKTYAAGSLVSHQGAGWIAQVESTGVRPGDGALWRLAIKRAKERVQ